MTGFISGLAAPISSLLELKHAIGLPYQTSERHLRAFDAMCARDYPGQDVLTRQMAMAWAAGRPGEHVNGQMRRGRVRHPARQPRQTSPLPAAHRHP